jgi:hypothetical protein
MGKLSVKMTKVKNSKKATKKVLDTFMTKRRPGRPQTVVPSAIEGRAHNYTGILDHVWDELWIPLSAADTEESVVSAFQSAIPNETEFSRSAALILGVLKERHFPKRRKARIRFLADSIAGLGAVTPRRSRDICAEERAREKRTERILRFEFYIECSCRYKGPSLHHACPKCHAPIPLDEGLFPYTMR